MAKPNIEEVFNAFQVFQTNQIKALSNNSPGAWEGEFQKLRVALREKLELMGLADHIDWGNPNAG